jgi:hypothetical protein
MDAGINNIIYMELYSGPKMANSICGKMIDTGTIDRGSTVYIQGDSGGICTTLGNDSMSDFKQKSSNEHGSDFERLRSYGHFLFPVHALM